MFWGSLAAGILIKGPLIVVIVATTLLTLCLIRRRWQWLLALRPLSGVLGVVLVTAPWLILILLRGEGSFLSDSIGTDFWSKVISGQQSKGFLPGFHLLMLPMILAPFSFLLPLSIPWIWRQGHLVLASSNHLGRASNHS